PQKLVNVKVADKKIGKPIRESKQPLIPWKRNGW
ncbi:hypothetical protein AAULR_07566, partial [Lacticaseibacillus rhamnosus MTCC 5462]